MMLSTTDKTQQFANIKLADYTPVSSVEKTDRNGWVNFGERNLFPQYLLELAETSPIHGALCVSIGDMIAGKTIDAGVYQSRVESLNTYDVYYGCAHDFKKFGGFYVEIIYSLDRKTIAKINHIPFEECRIAIEGDDEIEIGVWHSRDWETQNKKKKNKPVFIPKYNPASSMNESRQIYWCFRYTSGQTYPRPDYWSAVNYIELSKQIGIYHVNNIMNGLFPSFIVSFFNGQLNPEEQKEVQRDWERGLTGSRNAGKFIMTFNEPHATKPDIVPFPISDADKQYEYLSSASRNEVMTAHRVTTPLLFGIRDSAGGFGSNKDEMAVGLQIFINQVIEPAQRKIIGAFNDILSYEMPNIDLVVIPNTPLSEEQTAVTESSNPSDTTSQVSQSLSEEDMLDELLADESYEPTDEMAQEAELGLKWREEYGRGGTAVGVARARDISNKRNLSFDTVKRMYSYFARHEVDKKASGWNQGEDGFPSGGRIAWQLWGGDAGAGWSERIVNREKKKTEQSLDDKIADELIALGEDAPEGYILIDSYDVDYDNDDDENEKLEVLNYHELASTGNAKPKQVSTQDYFIDSKLFVTRYRYSGRLTANSRRFCEKMIVADKLYRKEDILRMGEMPVNKGWGPRGADTYSVWKYKGGGYCRHVWKKEVYVSSRGLRIDPDSPDTKKVAVSRAENQGYVIKNPWQVETRPYDMDNYGFLKSNPKP
jgi:hypothetical protein